MTRFILVDVEAAEGISPYSGKMTEFGAVDFASFQTFHGVLWDSQPHPDNPAISVITNTTPHDAHKVMSKFKKWLDSFNDRVVFVSDNPAYDFMWINEAFDRTLGENPFGYSARRIGDLYAGLTGKWRNTNRWKNYRVTAHDHNPVNDALGNAEALRTILEKYDQEF